jgi:hypothetical protein
MPNAVGALDIGDVSFSRLGEAMIKPPRRTLRWGQATHLMR